MYLAVHTLHKYTYVNDLSESVAYGTMLYAHTQQF